MLWHICISLLVLCLTVGGQLMSMITPSGVTACAATVLSWSGGVAPYSLIIVFKYQYAMKPISGISGTTFTWNVDVPATTGDQLYYIEVQDSTTLHAYTKDFTIAPGNCHSSTTTTESQASSLALSAQETSTAPTPVIIGSVIGGVVVLIIIIGSILWYKKRKRHHHNTRDDGVVHVSGGVNASAFPSLLEERSSSAPLPWAVPLRPSTNASQPMTNSSERALRSSNLPQQDSSSWKSSYPPPPDSLLHRESLSNSGPLQTIGDNRIPYSLPYPTSLLAPQSPDLFPVPLSPRPPTYFTIDMTPSQSNSPEFESSMARNVVGRTLTDSDVEAIARRVTEMQRDQRP